MISRSLHNKLPNSRLMGKVLSISGIEIYYIIIISLNMFESIMTSFFYHSPLLIYLRILTKNYLGSRSMIM